MRYAQITDSGYVISDSYLTGKVELPDMIPIPAVSYTHLTLPTIA